MSRIVGGHGESSCRQTQSQVTQRNVWPWVYRGFGQIVWLAALEGVSNSPMSDYAVVGIGYLVLNILTKAQADVSVLIHLSNRGPLLQCSGSFDVV